MYLRPLLWLALLSATGSASLFDKTRLEQELAEAPLVAEITIESVETRADAVQLNRFHAVAHVDRVISKSTSVPDREWVEIEGVGGERESIGVFFSGFPRPHRAERYRAYLRPHADGADTVVGLERGFVPLSLHRNYTRNRTDGSDGAGNGPFLYWKDGTFPLSYVVSVPTFSNRPDYITAIQKSFATWQAAPNVKVNFIAMGCTQNTKNQNDGVNTIILMTDEWPFDPAAIALTRNFYIAGETNEAGLILDSDILLNGVDHRFTTTNETGKHDMQNILTHEIGHLLGLGHETSPYDSDAVMYAVASPNEINKQTLKADDVAAIRSAYEGVAENFGAPGALCDVSASDGGSCLSVHAATTTPPNLLWPVVYLLCVLGMGRRWMVRTSEKKQLL